MDSVLLLKKEKPMATRPCLATIMMNRHHYMFAIICWQIFVFRSIVVWWEPWSEFNQRTISRGIIREKHFQLPSYINIITLHYFSWTYLICHYVGQRLSQFSNFLNWLVCYYISGKVLQQCWKILRGVFCNI